uniref:Uncharacterized protein n=1 Tax=Oryza meridionalis TaxID=40149 RepID=A0A0E0ES88_9ORYZ
MELDSALGYVVAPGHGSRTKNFPFRPQPLCWEEVGGPRWWGGDGGGKVVEESTDLRRGQPGDGGGRRTCHARQRVGEEAYRIWMRDDGRDDRAVRVGGGRCLGVYLQCQHGGRATSAPMATSGDGRRERVDRAEGNAVGRSQQRRTGEREGERCGQMERGKGATKEECEEDRSSRHRGRIEGKGGGGGSTGEIEEDDLKHGGEQSGATARRSGAAAREGSEAAAGREGRWNGARAAEQPGGVGRRVPELADGQRHKTAATTVDGGATAKTEGTGRNSMTQATHHGRRRLRKSSRISGANSSSSSLSPSSLSRLHCHNDVHVEGQARSQKTSFPSRTWHNLREKWRSSMTARPCMPMYSICQMRLLMWTVDKILKVPDVNCLTEDGAPSAIFPVAMTLSTA